MNEIIRDRLKVEYETTDITYEELFNKYNIDSKKLKGYKSWTKNLLKPITKSEQRKHLDTHIDIVANNMDKVEVSEDILIVKDKDSKDLFATKKLDIEDKEVKTSIIHQASQDILEGKQAKLPQKLKDGYDGLRSLDTDMQNQAIALLRLIGTGIGNIDETDTKGIKELVTAHTSLRDSYFNSKNTMVSIINGDVTNNTQTNLASFIQEAEDDC